VTLDLTDLNKGTTVSIIPVKVGNF
jgi:hypothetical protein